MTRTQLNVAATLFFLFPLFAVAESSMPHEGSHLDVLKVNPSLQLHEVLEKTVARSPMQATLQSREFGVDAKNIVAKSMLPSTPAVSVGHQNDALGSGRGEREWQADLEVPVWLPNQRNNRLKVADATQSSLTAGRESLKLQVAGQLRDAVWDIALNDSNFALALNKFELASKLQRDVEKRYQMGEMAKTDVMLAQQETLRAEKEKLRAEAEVMHARNRYYLLTGLREIPASFAEPQSSLEDYSQSSIWTEAQSKVGLAETERELAQVESRENLQVLFNMRSIKGGFDNTANESVGVKVRIPFGSESHSAPIKAAAELGVGNALSEREKLRNVMDIMLHEAEHNLNVSRAELVIVTKQFDIAKESARLAEKAFQLGETDLVSLMRVQALSYEAERAFTSRKIQVQWDIARYNQAVGVLP
ncbi:MAG: TolC family protein [Methylotenera sp.]|nr:TolC family protein [Methylotenera sp.]